MAQNFQITQVNSNGSVVVMHPESNADLILTGSTNRVPTIANITDWSSKSTEVVNARKGEANLKAKMDKIDVALTPQELLKAIKTVDGTNSGLDADLVDGCTVNDGLTTTTNLWTASNTQSKLNTKVNATDVVTTATANKLLRLNSNGALPASITGNAPTASALASTLNLNFGGDVVGSAAFTGKEGNISVNLEVKDDSHSHSSLNGISINDFKIDNKSLWTSLQTMGAIEEAVGSVVNIKDGDLSIGSIKIKYGSVDIANKNTADIVFKTPLVNGILFNGCSCETSDLDIVATIGPGTATKDGMQINLNKTATDGKLVWFALGL